MNPILIDFGIIQIRWYSVLILAAACIVLIMAQNEAERHGELREFMFNMLFWALIFGLIGARLYYVIFNINSYIKNPMEIFQVWHGGLAIHGGLIAGLLTVIYYCHKYKARVLRNLDYICVPLLLGQAIGRWGNFFNQEAHGAATTVIHLKSLHIPDFIINGMTIDGVVYTPTFLYESIVCLAAFLFLMILRRFKYTKVGTPTASYLVIYGTLRLFIEMTRTDALMLGPFKVAQIVSVIMIIVGIGMLMYTSKKGRFEDLYSAKAPKDEIRF